MVADNEGNGGYVDLGACRVLTCPSLAVVPGLPAVCRSERASEQCMYVCPARDHRLSQIVSGHCVLMPSCHSLLSQLLSAAGSATNKVSAGGRSALPQAYVCPCITSLAYCWGLWNCSSCCKKGRRPSCTGAAGLQAFVTHHAPNQR
jgi:hypothetical protein